MNDNQKRQIEMARRESEQKSYCIDATGNRSMGHQISEHMQVDRHEMRMNETQMKSQMPMYQKDGVS